MVSLGLCWDHPSGKGQGQLSPEDGAALPWALVITWPTDLNTDPGSSKATDPHMTLGCSLSFNFSMASGSSSDHSDQCGPSSSMPLRHHRGHGHLHSPQKYHRPWTSTQTWSVVGPQIQTTSHEPQVTAPISQFLSNAVSSVPLSPLGSNCSAPS